MCLMSGGETGEMAGGEGEERIPTSSLHTMEQNKFQMDETKDVKTMKLEELE